MKSKKSQNVELGILESLSTTFSKLPSIQLSTTFSPIPGLTIAQAQEMLNRFHEDVINAREDTKQNHKEKPTLDDLISRLQNI